MTILDVGKSTAFRWSGLGRRGVVRGGGGGVMREKKCAKFLNPTRRENIYQHYWFPPLVKNSAKQNNVLGVMFKNMF